MTSTFRLQLAALGLVLACLLAAATTAWPAARGRAAVTVVQVSAPPKSVLAGAGFRITETTRSVGRRASGRTVTVYLASSDRRASGDDLRLGTRLVRGLRPGRTSRARRLATVPVTARPATYWLIACAGIRPALRRYAAATCRVAARRFVVLPAVPTNAAAPAIAGQASDGRRLTAKRGTWRGLEPIEYANRWRRCNTAGKACTDISGATAPTYTVSSADVGSTLRVAVIARNARGTRPAVSRQTPKVTRMAPVSTAPPAVFGKGVPGQTLTATPGTWRGTPPLAFAYQWQRCDAGGACSSIGGATASTYTVAQGDVGPSLRVAVTASNPGHSGKASSAAVPTGVFANPVFGSRAPDPFVLDNGGGHGDYWEFHTGGLFPILHSTDLVSWTPAGTAFATRPTWVVPSGDWHPWAPSVRQISAPCPASGPCYVMYYVGLSAAYGVNCVGVATATAPGGPYTDLGPLTQFNVAGGRPIGCGDAQGSGNIDPSPFIDDDGKAYLYTSTDDTPPGTLAPTVSVMPLTADLLQASGPRTPLFPGAAGTWEAAGAPAPTVEGPTMLKHSGIYYLLYSGGSWVRSYGMGYATSSSPTGPFTKAAANPILTAAGTAFTPGGGDTVLTGPHGATWMAYHAREGSASAFRTLWIDRFSFKATSGGPDAPVIAGPTGTAQPTAP